MGVPLLGKLIAYRTATVRGLAMTALLSVLLFNGAACGRATPQSTATASMSQETDTEDGHVLPNQQVAQLNESIRTVNGEPEMIVAEARPSYRVSNGTVTMMTIRDESASSQPAGMYTLTTQCIGTGELDVRFTMGDQTVQDVMRCSAGSISNGTMSLDVDETDRVVVEIAPSDGAKAEIAYRIDATDRGQ